MVVSPGTASGTDGARAQREPPDPARRARRPLARRRWPLVIVALLLAHGAAAAQPDGRALYLLHCAPCHGRLAAGDGPDAALFDPPPPALRSLTAQSTQAIARTILDGGRQAVVFDVPAMRARATDTEALATHLHRLPSVDWRAVDAGQVLFAERCAPCHGALGRPPDRAPAGVRPPRDLGDPEYQRATSDAEIVIAVRHGRKGMPALTPRLTADEARNVAAFVRLLSPGYATYTQYCAQCHGDHGIGVGSMAESFPVPTVIFDQAYFARHDADALHAAIWHMLERHQPAMPHFRGTLSQTQAEAIARYLKTLADQR